MAISRLIVYEFKNLDTVDFDFRHSFLIPGSNSIMVRLHCQPIISMVCKTIQLLACLHKLIDCSSSNIVVSQSVIMLGKVILVTLKVSLV